MKEKKEPLCHASPFFPCILCNNYEKDGMYCKLKLRRLEPKKRCYEGKDKEYKTKW